jgi:hypothetical protein
MSYLKAQSHPIGLFYGFFMFHAYSLIKVPHLCVAQLNNALSHSARKTGLTTLFSAALVQPVPALEYAYFLFRPE